jgi:hypothetical protein
LPFNLLKDNRFKVAEPTGFEPATSDVTGRRSNQLNYDSAFKPEMSKEDRKLDLSKRALQHDTVSARRQQEPYPDNGKW